MLNQFLEKISTAYNSKKTLFLIISLGILLRLIEYLHSRSFWIDEAMLGVNIIEKSFPQLLQGLDLNQVAPIGFLMIEKLIISGFGNSELAFRFFPFICSIISIFLFFRLAHYFINPRAMPVALGIFVLVPGLIYYATELKQYSSDVAVTLLIYLVATHIYFKDLTARNVLMFGIVGALAVWFSMPSVFILAGVGSSFILIDVMKKEHANLGRLSMAYIMWGLSFLLCYYLVFPSDNLAQQQHAFGQGLNSFMPFPPTKPEDLKWFFDRLLGLTGLPFGLRSEQALFRTFENVNDAELFVRLVAYNLRGLLAIIVALIFMTGFVSMFIENKEKLFMLMAPLLFVFLASGLCLYPFEPRLLLFFLPSVILVIAHGAEQIGNKTIYQPVITGIVLFCVLCAYPMLSASYHIVKPRNAEDISPALKYIEKHQQAEDIVYFYCADYRVINFYSLSYDFKIAGIADGNWHPDELYDDLSFLKGNNRVWIVFSNFCKWKGLQLLRPGEFYDGESYSVKYLDESGTRLNAVTFKHGTSLYLYDLNK